MRNILFAAAYWALSIFYAFAATFLAILPGRRPVTWAIRRYSRRMVQAMGLIAGIKVDLRGKERLPQGAFIIAAKHHSWGDGFVMFANVENLSSVTGDHLERIPLLGGILRKLGAIVVDNCGGPEARKALSDSAAVAHKEGKRILIYPEGHLAKPNEHFRYRSGIWHMYADFDLPVVPVATNLGCFWEQVSFEKKPGAATVEFLDPIPTGLPKAEFLARLEATIEGRSQELIAMATGEAVRPSALVAFPGEEDRKASAA